VAAGPNGSADLTTNRRLEMAEAGVFVGWSTPVRGREESGLDVFSEALALDAQLQEEGAIEDFEVVLLSPHGGGLAGFILARGSKDQLVALRAREDFLRINARAAMVVDDLGVVDVALGSGVEEQIGRYREAIKNLA
jgi:hypothetical protein